MAAEREITLRVRLAWSAAVPWRSTSLDAREGRSAAASGPGDGRPRVRLLFRTRLRRRPGAASFLHTSRVVAFLDLFLAFIN